MSIWAGLKLNAIHTCCTIICMLHAPNIIFNNWNLTRHVLCSLSGRQSSTDFIVDHISSLAINFHMFLYTHTLLSKPGPLFFSLPISYMVRLHRTWTMRSLKALSHWYSYLWGRIRFDWQARAVFCSMGAERAELSQGCPLTGLHGVDWHWQ